MGNFFGIPNTDHSDTNVDHEFDASDEIPHGQCIETLQLNLGQKLLEYCALDKTNRKAMRGFKHKLDKMFQDMANSGVCKIEYVNFLRSLASVGVRTRPMDWDGEEIPISKKPRTHYTSSSSPSSSSSSSSS